MSEHVTEVGRGESEKRKALRMSPIETLGWFLDVLVPENTRLEAGSYRGKGIFHSLLCQEQPVSRWSEADRDHQVLILDLLGSMPKSPCQRSFRCQLAELESRVH